MKTFFYLLMGLLKVILIPIYPVAYLINNLVRWGRGKDSYNYFEKFINWMEGF